MNELNSSNSAYLKHHAQNPIHRKNWSKKTLDNTLLKNKLIILIIGFSRMPLVSCYGERNIQQLANCKFYEPKLYFYQSIEGRTSGYG